jgi:hypothetical protein
MKLWDRERIVSPAPRRAWVSESEHLEHSRLRQGVPPQTACTELGVKPGCCPG